jgi:acetolactate decarboxylase
MRGVSLTGWHLHFLTEDHHGGGHVLSFTTDDVRLEADEAHHFNWLIPGMETYKREEFK